MNCPNIVDVCHIIEDARSNSCGLPDGRWVPARSLSFGSPWYRIRATWLVFTGKADALTWPGQ